MTEETIQDEVGGVRLALPIVDDVDTTRRIAARVNDRLREIEAESDRIDTHRFALLAAVSFATEVEECQRKHDQDTRDLLKALNRLLTSLRALLDAAEE